LREGAVAADLTNQLNAVDEAGLGKAIGTITVTEST
jgi:hypothetical protein